MSEMKFKYFRDPSNFTFRIEEKSACTICEAIGLWHDAGGYCGDKEIECICDNCLAQGKLKSLGIETNLASEGSQDDIETIIYKTPSLPTWQDRTWPFINGEYCIFEKIASKYDFSNKDEFKESFSDSDKKDSDLDWLWDWLPDTEFSNLEDGSYDVSIYLFTCNGIKHCIWDAS